VKWQRTAAPAISNSRSRVRWTGIFRVKHGFFDGRQGVRQEDRIAVTADQQPAMRACDFSAFDRPREPPFKSIDLKRPAANRIRTTGKIHSASRAKEKVATLNKRSGAKINERSAGKNRQGDTARSLQLVYIEPHRLFLGAVLRTVDRFVHLVSCCRRYYALSTHYRIPFLAVNSRRNNFEKYFRRAKIFPVSAAQLSLPACVQT
jgi:hypothetical protein